MHIEHHCGIKASLLNMKNESFIIIEKKCVICREQHPKSHSICKQKKKWLSGIVNYSEQI